MDVKRKVSFCTDCMSPSTRGFKKVITLKNSGLFIYQHIEDESKNHSTLKETKKNSADKSKRLDKFILHNDSEHDLRRQDYAIEMCQLRTRCCRCINMGKRVRSLLDELNDIRKNQVIGLCEHCKRNPGACRRCQYIVKKFLDTKTALRKEKQEQFRSWISKLNKFLNYALNDENLDSQINSDPSALGLERLLQELKEPLQLKNLYTNFFPTDLAQLSSMTTVNEMIDELITKIKPEDLRKSASGEDLPPIGEGMQLPKEHQKEVTEPHRKIEIKKEKNKVISETTSKGSTSKPEANANASKNQSQKTSSNVIKSHRMTDSKKEQHKSISEKTSKGSISNLLEKDNTSKYQSKDNLGYIAEFSSKENVKNEKHKVISEKTSKGSISNLLEKDNAPKYQSKDNLGNIAEFPSKENVKNEKRKVISEKTSKGSISNLLEKDNAPKYQSKDNLGNNAEFPSKENVKNEKHKLISEKTNQVSKKEQNKPSSTLKPILKKLNIGGGKENKNSEANNTKEKKLSDVSGKNLFENDHRHKKGEKSVKDKNKKSNNFDIVKFASIHKNRKGSEKKDQYTNRFANVVSSVKMLGAGDDEDSYVECDHQGPDLITEMIKKTKSNDIDIVKFASNHKNGKGRKKEDQYTNRFANVVSSVKMLEAGDDEDSYVECDHQGPDLITEMIKKTKLVKYKPHYKDNLPIPEPEEDILPHLFVDTVIQEERHSNISSAGVLRYKLSDKTFISKGYTILPVLKVLKRDNLYKMEPVNPQFNWFERHKDISTKNYDTGEILAVINENGTGRWFYKNGQIALDCYDSEDVEVGRRRYVLYSSGEESNQDPGARLKELKNKPQVLGVFDIIGNGVVYDLHGNERIKYNQTDGMIIDSKIGPVGRWKWHSLNDPPVLQPIVIDNYDNSSCIRNLDITPRYHGKSEYKRHQNPEVLQAELQLFAKQKAHKMVQKFQPYQIRMKAFKINDDFSLRIINQANIYLLYRHGTVSMKLNLGLHLVSNEIVQTDVSEVGGVATPYDRILPRTSIIANIQTNLKNPRNLQSRAKARKTPGT